MATEQQKNKVFEQDSKEFQMKLRWPADGVAPGATPEAVDQQLLAIACAAIRTAVAQVAADKKSACRFNDVPWLREGIRYDTAGRDLKRLYLTLAIEATDTATKLKCKQHQFVPELLFDAKGDSPCWPDAASVGGKLGQTQFKLEQDLHFDNLKYCTSGSLYRKGRRTDVTDLGFFSRHFPRLAKLLPATSPLVPLTHWRETVFDDFSVCIGRRRINTWMLVTRRDWDSGQLLESELSFKVIKERGDDWDLKELQLGSALYLALQKTGVFQPLPPIFLYDNPVSSVDIRLA